jgi:hypothetical protein
LVAYFWVTSRECRRSDAIEVEEVDVELQSAAHRLLDGNPGRRLPGLPQRLACERGLQLLGRDTARADGHFAQALLRWRFSTHEIGALQPSVHGQDLPIRT